MGIVGGTGRHYDGHLPRELAVGEWVCRACGARHLTPLEKGCPKCGAGTAAQAEAALRTPRKEVPWERVVKEVTTEFWGAELSGYQSADRQPLLEHLSEHARTTIAVALAHYADHGSPSNSELPRAVIHAWARKLAETIVYADEDGAGAPPATPPATPKE